MEQYRPSTIDDLVLPENIKGTFREIISQDKIPNLILSGSAGVGKTSAAMVLCKALNCDYIIVNGSDEGRLIETLRNKLTQYCSSVSMSGGRKVVIMDEADYMTPDSVQPAMRGFMEKFSSNCSFIFTCNFKNRIIEPIHSRCPVIDYRITDTDKQQLASDTVRNAYGTEIFIDSDHQQSSYKVYPNEREVTEERTYEGNVKSLVSAETTQLQDNIKTTIYNADSSW